MIVSRLRGHEDRGCGWTTTVRQLQGRRKQNGLVSPSLPPNLPVSTPDRRQKHSNATNAPPPAAATSTWCWEVRASPSFSSGTTKKAARPRRARKHDGVPLRSGATKAIAIACLSSRMPTQNGSKFAETRTHGGRAGVRPYGWTNKAAGPSPMLSSNSTWQRIFRGRTVRKGEDTTRAMLRMDPVSCWACALWQRHRFHGQVPQGCVRWRWVSPQRKQGQGGA
mmetsp:Transcript_60430/g.131190  ORF Transcript_60430/g.131190 Transcript_60430/m.131190 type:complete len:223 (+) Transcript_60430:762-1430(+)